MPRSSSFLAAALTAVALLSVGVVTASAAGCSKSYIPNTDVEDTSENRKVVSFCEKYRRAVEERDIEGLVSMASTRYFETGGNAKSGDDIDYNGLRKYLATKFKITKAIRYEIRYHRISETENKQRQGIPILDSIPGVGDAFSHQTNTRGRTELILFIRPTLIKDAVDASVIAEEMRSKMNSRLVGTSNPVVVVDPPRAAR